MKVQSKLKECPKGKSLTIQFVWNAADVKQALKYVKSRIDEGESIEKDNLLSYIMVANSIRDYGVSDDIKKHIGQWMLKQAIAMGLVWDMGEYGGEPDTLVISDTLEQTMRGRKGLSRPFPGKKKNEIAQD